MDLRARGITGPCVVHLHMDDVQLAGGEIVATQQVIELDPVDDLTEKPVGRCVDTDVDGPVQDHRVAGIVGQTRITVVRHPMRRCIAATVIDDIVTDQ